MKDEKSFPLVDGDRETDDTIDNKKSAHAIDSHYINPPHFFPFPCSDYCA